MFSIQLKNVASHCCGTNTVLALRAPRRSPAAPASWRRRTIDRSGYGSITAPERSPCGTLWVFGSILSSSPSASSRSTILLRAAKRSRPCSASVSSSFGRRRHAVKKCGVVLADRAAPSTSSMLTSGRSCRRPTSKSLKSCAGVIFTAPVPFSGSAYSSATIGMRRPTSGRIAVLPIRCLRRSFSRMHGDGGVAQHRLRPRRRDDDEFVAALDRIFDVPEAALDLDLLHFEIGDRGLELGVPIDEALVLVDQAVAIKLDEHLHHRARQPFVHGEALARPVAGGAEPLELADDGAAGFRLPFPDALDERLAAHFAAARLLALHQLALDHGLRGDAGVVGAGLPQHVLAAHALEAAQDVLQRVVERVAHVQRAGHVGRRDDDAVGLAPWRARAGRRGRRRPLPMRRRCGPRPRRAGRSCRSSLLRFCRHRGLRNPRRTQCQRRCRQRLAQNRTAGRSTAKRRTFRSGRGGRPA